MSCGAGIFHPGKPHLKLALLTIGLCYTTSPAALSSKAALQYTPISVRAAPSFMMAPDFAGHQAGVSKALHSLHFHLPLFGDFILPLHLLFLKLPNVTYTNLPTKFFKHLILYLRDAKEGKSPLGQSAASSLSPAQTHLLAWLIPHQPGSSSLSSLSFPSLGFGWSSWYHWCEARSWLARSPAWTFPTGEGVEKVKGDQALWRKRGIPSTLVPRTQKASSPHAKRTWLT